MFYLGVMVYSFTWVWNGATYAFRRPEDRQATRQAERVTPLSFEQKVATKSVELATQFSTGNVEALGLTVTPTLRITPTSTPAPMLYFLLPDGSKVQAGVQITLTPTPRAVQVYSTSQVGNIEIFQLSFYDPYIGKDYPERADINCSRWNKVTQDCDSSLSDGTNYREGYWNAVACREELFNQRAHYRVLYPYWLAQAFPEATCRDKGDMIQGNLIDFEIPYKELPGGYTLENFPWRSVVVLERIP